MKYSEYKTIPNRLRRYRRERGLNQKEVAKLLGMNNSNIISKWEKGNCIPNIVNAMKLSILYHVMVDALFFDLRYSMREEIRQLEKNLIGVQSSQSKIQKNG